MGLVMFWLGLVKFLSYNDLLIISIWCAHYINWNAHFLFGMHIIFGVHIIFIGLHIFILCEHKKVCILYLFCVLPGMSYYLFFLQGIFKGHIFTKSMFPYLICPYMGSLRSQYSLKWIKIIITMLNGDQIAYMLTGVNIYTYCIYNLYNKQICTRKLMSLFHD